MVGPGTSSEQKVLEAARLVFHQRGFAGARMEEIAKEAGINKALLHYYFRSKERLFDEVFKEAVMGFLPRLMEILGGDMPLDMKIYKVVDFYCNTLVKNRDIPVFVLTELRQNPAKVVELISEQAHHSLEKFMTQIQNEVAQGNIKPIDPKHFFANLLSLLIFPFVAEPLLLRLFDLDEKAFQNFINERKRIIPDILLGSLKKTT